VVLQEYGGSEKLTFEDNVPVQIGGGTAPMAGAPASVNPSAGKYVQGCGRRVFRCRFLSFSARRNWWDDISELRGQGNVSTF